MGAIYFVDTSEWINLSRLYPKSVFSSLWDNVENLISKERILSPKEVRDELKRGHDELAEWCRAHQKMFRSTSRLTEQVKKIIDEHPELVDPNAPYESADPYIIALAASCKRDIPGLSPIIVRMRMSARNHAFRMPPEPTVCKRASWWKCFKGRGGNSRKAEIIAASNTVS